MTLPRVLVLDDLTYWSQDHRRLFCDNFAVRDSNNAYSGDDREYLAEVEFASPQKREGNHVIDDIEEAMRSIERRWKTGSQRWALVLLDLHFTSGEMLNGDLHSPLNVANTQTDPDLGFKVLQEMQQRWPDPTDQRKTSIPVVVLSSQDQRTEERRLNELGALDYLQRYDLESERFSARKRFGRFLSRNGLLEYDQLRVVRDDGKVQVLPVDKPIVGRSLSLLKSLREARRAASVDDCCLLLGESGTGKELFASYILRNSARSAKPFCPLDTGAIPLTMIEDTLFGHVRGAFTGATGAKNGLFQQANSGTLFLDEIGNMPIEVQVRLLRAIAAGEVQQIGSEKVQPVNVRLIAATDKNLDAAMDRGAFLPQLYYRLASHVVRIPSLAERPEDIPLLFDYFFAINGTSKYTQKKDVEPEVYARLASYQWKGNVRELENVTKWIALRRQDALTIGDGDLPPSIVNREKKDDAGPQPEVELTGPFIGAVKGSLNRIEENYGRLIGELMSRALNETRDKIDRSAPQGAARREKDQALGSLSPTRAISFLRNVEMSTNDAAAMITRLCKTFPKILDVGGDVRTIYRWAKERQGVRKRKG